MRLRLTEADRQRFNCPEFLPISLDGLTNKEAIVLKKLGFPTPRLLVRALQESAQYEAWTAAVWLALKRAGIDVPVEDLEFDIAVEVLGDEEPADPVVVEEGKAEEVLEASTSSADSNSTSTET